VIVNKPLRVVINKGVSMLAKARKLNHKVGDKVRIIRVEEYGYDKWIGKVLRISEIDESRTYPYQLGKQRLFWHDKELQSVVSINSIGGTAV